MLLPVVGMEVKSLRFLQSPDGPFREASEFFAWDSSESTR